MKIMELNRPLGWLLALCLGAPAALSQSAPTSPLPGADTETIYCISHVKQGKEAEYAALCAQAWSIYRRLDLVLEKPHVLFRGADASGKSYFGEIFTWKNSTIPDHAPDEVREIWRKLQSDCEPRGGRPGMDFSEDGVTVLAVD